VRRETDRQGDPVEVCRVPTKGKADVNFIKRIVAGRATPSSSAVAMSSANGKREKDGYIAACRRRAELQPASPGQDSPDHYFHDGRQRDP